MENVKTEVLDARIDDLLDSFDIKFSSDRKYLFSSPGRIEISGNHTDHNNGHVVAAAIDLDSLAVVSKTDDMKVNFISVNLNQNVSINLDDLKLRADETGKTSSLIRGIASKFVEDGHIIGGFNCIVESKVAIGSGLSSSASIEILIGEIFNYFYNDDNIDPIELAKIGQYAENKYFGKPCGLMDQLAISYGGIVGIDFLDSDVPKVSNVNNDLSDFNYSFLIVNTGGSHADLTDDYASIPKEMHAIANYFNKPSLRFVERKNIMDNIAELSNKFGDRAILRAFHFFEEDKRAASLIDLLNQNDYDGFLSSVNEAGNSSFMWLQNAYSNNDINHQGISLALELTGNFLKKNNYSGAVKIHGGGFAGTILSIISNNIVGEYIVEMEKVFGENSVTKVSIRNSGTKFIKEI